MQYSSFLALALITGLTVQAADESDVRSTLNAVAAIGGEYLVAHRKDDPRFVVSVQRIAVCTLAGSPVTGDHLVVPYQIYPQESVRKHEEGTVKMQLIFDSEWCVRKAIVVESSKFWRLDFVSLQWAMAIKWTPKKPLYTSDGEPMITIPVAWGESQRKR
jgi:hypothetical protein